MLRGPSRLKDIAEERAARTRAYSAQMAELREAIGRGLADETPISMERLGIELEKNLDRDTCYVADVDSGKTMDPLMSFGGDAKHYFGTGPNVLGWGMAAGFYNNGCDDARCYASICRRIDRCRNVKNLPPAKPVALPDGRGKDLVATRCALCHDLERIVAVKRGKQAWPVIVADMVERGAPATAEDAKVISDYLGANFGN